MEDLNLSTSLFADLHIHSRFSRACSKELTIPNLVKWARIKGINLLGTGDFTHNTWLEELKELKQENGILWYEDSEGKFPFILTSEISLVYTQDEKGRRVHLVYLAPDFETVDKINQWLDTKGRRDYDGRPIFKISCRDFTAKMQEINPEIEVIPAHCLLPDSLIHTEKIMKKIKEIKKGDKVLTHSGRFRKVKNVYSRDFSGDIIEVIPSCLKIGSWFTPEHPIYSIKTFKSCKNVPHTICKPSCSYLKRGCKIKAYEKYKPQWKQIKELEIGDVILYPRYKKIKDISYLDLSEIFKEFFIDGDYIKPRKEKVFIKNIPIKKRINLSGNFCRLIGYYLAEGYISGNSIAFTFNKKEKSYLLDLKKLLVEIFGPFLNIQIIDEKSEGVTLKVFSKVLFEFFKMFYVPDSSFRAYNKILPNWFLDLPIDKLQNLFVGWWRGDKGVTTSVNLMNQFKIILIKIGIIPSINKVTANQVNLSRKKKINVINRRKIIARKDYYTFSPLSFFNESCELLELPEFKKFKTKLLRRKGWLDNDYIYLPIFKINKKRYLGEVYNLEVLEDNSYLSENLAIHNCWTPWFGVFGSKGGFNTLQEAFQDQAQNIHAIETGISSDPEMNIKIKEIKDRNISIVSFSDSHSFWPWRLGREATIFQKPENQPITYNTILNQIRTNTFIGTIETDPAYGKYHFDGHAKCNFSSSPEKTKELNNICPECNKNLIIGVDSRVNELSNNQEIIPSKLFFRVLPLHEIISLHLKKGMNTKTCWTVYNNLIKEFKTEFNILLKTTKEELTKITNSPELTNLILQNRKGKIKVKPGYDGVYGEAILSEEDNQQTENNPNNQQPTNPQQLQDNTQINNSQQPKKQQTLF
jgi:uncharacterized protein (TIGR00375 family)